MGFIVSLPSGRGLSDCHLEACHANMKLLIYSDVHLERQPFTPGPHAQEADLVVLAGDIGQGIEGLHWARRTFKNQPIVMVLGNHEFFGGQDFVDFVDVARNEAFALDIDLLECSAATIDGVRFLGATMWTDFELLSPDPEEFRLLRKEAQESIKDYSPGHIKSAISLKDQGVTYGALTPELTISRHWQTRKWLETELADGTSAKTVVVTHHCPNINSIPPQFRTGGSSKFSPAYASDLSHLGGRCELWIHGHVHESADYDMNGTRVVCNPMGYCSQELGPQNRRFTDLLIDV